ncbi:MAG: RNA-guided endonuclease TnpB family protein [Candidatus Omnitrophica bacterium]|jgi:putative transposase|nr:RNA-guided endonuclease TnpB family protein [Candidatus Omnitrophota bacterium]
MILTFKTKLKLDSTQTEILNKLSEEARVIYNYNLDSKLKYYDETKKYLSYFTQQKELKNFKTELLTYDGKKEVLLNLERNYKSFFSLIKKNKELHPKPPKFRGKNYFFTLSYTQDFIIKNNKILISLNEWKRLELNLEYIKPIENLICKRSKTKESQIKQLKIYKKDDNYFASITYEKQEQPVVTTNNLISIDLGKKNLVSYFNPNENTGVIYNSKFLSKNQKHLDKRIDELKSIRDTKKKFSRNWKHINNKIKKLCSKKKTQTNLTLQKLSKDLTKLDSIILIGELTNLKQNIKSDYLCKLNRQMQGNWNLSTFIHLLEYKSKLKGNQVIKVNEAWTSKTCCKCGSINNDLTLSDREYICECGNNINRDINGAINIYKNIWVIIIHQLILIHYQFQKDFLGVILRK